MINILFDVGGDNDVLPTQCRAELRFALDLLTKPDATGTVNTPGHIRGDERSDVLVFHDAFAVVIA